MLPDISHDTAGGAQAPVTGDPLARQQAIKQIERKRRFWIGAAMGTLAMAVLTLIWAMSEYHNAGGWPADGVQPELGDSERLELLDHVPGHRLGLPDGRRGVVGVPAEADFRTRHPARNGAAARAALTVAGNNRI